MVTDANRCHPTLVYVAPSQRGIKGRGADPRRRPEPRQPAHRPALEPALEQNRAPDRSRLRPDARTARSRLGHTMARKLVVEIVGDSRSLERAFARPTRAPRSFNRDMTAASSRDAARVSAVSAEPHRARRRLRRSRRAGRRRQASFSEMAEAQKVIGQTAAASSRPAARPTSPPNRSKALAKQSMQQTGIDDEAIQSGENMLLTFTRIRNEVGDGNDIFNQATRPPWTCRWRWASRHDPVRPAARSKH